MGLWLVAVMVLATAAGCTLGQVTPGPTGQPPATPVSEAPAAGVCVAIEAWTVTVAVRPDVPSPRCVQVRPDQRLEVVNETDNQVQLRLGPYQAQLAPGQRHLFEAELGMYLAPGVHRLEAVGSAGGPEIWLAAP